MSTFQQVADELTDGCGCACHTGIGHRSSCGHCFLNYWAPAVSQTPWLPPAWYGNATGGGH